MKFSIIAIMGRSGSGKGTQAKLLAKKTGFQIIGTGDLLRKRARRKDILGKIIKGVLSRGGLIPTPIVFSLWMPLLEGFKRKGRARGIIFDGNPRKLYEGKMLEEMFEMFGWGGRLRICHIRLSEKEVIKRLLQRKRSDDTWRKIKGRLAYFPQEVEPMLRYYKKKRILIEVNGKQPVERLHKEILGKLKTFLK